MQLTDVYKLVHQASLGSEHAVGDLASVQRWLDDELAALGTGPDDALEDTIAPDGSILRIHLRPFVAQGGDPGVLMQAFIRTANEFHGSVDMLKVFWTEVVRLAEAGKLPFPPADVQKFGEEMAARGYPAAHHSQIYRTSYRPAYRVIANLFF